MQPSIAAHASPKIKFWSAGRLGHYFNIMIVILYSGVYTSIGIDCAHIASVSRVFRAFFLVFSPTTKKKQQFFGSAPRHKIYSELPTHLVKGRENNLLASRVKKEVIFSSLRRVVCSNELYYLHYITIIKIKILSRAL